MKPKHKHDKDGVICNHVQKGKRPLRIVAHDKDGVWQFMCGLEDHTNPRQAKKACVTCVFEKHAGTLNIGDVPKGHIAKRGNSLAPWTVREMISEELGQIDDQDADASQQPG